MAPKSRGPFADDEASPRRTYGSPTNAFVAAIRAEAGVSGCVPIGLPCVVGPLFAAVFAATAAA